MCKLAAPVAVGSCRLVVFPLVALVFAGGAVCTQPVTPIECIPVTACPVFIKLLRQRPVPQLHIDAIRSANCGFENLIEKVWCPIGLKSAENVTATIATTTTEGAMVKSRDSGTEKPKTKDALLPNDAECGQHFNTDKIFGGDPAGIDEFPWMTILYYQTSGGDTGRGCGGVLINKRYVLTAAHCVRKSLRYVVLGEYDVRNETDCIYYEGNRTDCADKPQQIQVMTKIRHPSYTPGDLDNDIALLRLRRDATFTDFVAPLCLPLRKVAELRPGTKLQTAGWGLTKQGELSPIKLRVEVPVVSRSDCTRAQGITINNTMICAGGEKNKDSCKGDSGGPLMYFDQITTNWRQVGIVSFSLKPCGTEGVPAVYTYVPPFLEWIYQTIY